MDLNLVNSTNIFYGLKRLATENFGLLELPFLAIKGIVSIFWYLIKAVVKGILWVLCSPFLAY